MEIVGFIVLGIIAVLMLTQLWFQYRMKRLEGTPVPESLQADSAAASAVLYYFYSDACGPCRRVSPLVKKLAEERPETVKLIDVAVDPETPRQLGIMGTPSFVLMKNSLIDQILMGPQSEKKLRSLMDN